MATFRHHRSDVISQIYYMVSGSLTQDVIEDDDIKNNGIKVSPLNILAMISNFAVFFSWVTTQRRW